MSPKILGPLVALHVVAAWMFLRGAGPGFPLDDAWIHMVYARAFGAGEGFAYNPGELQTGVTAPLWTMLLALPVTAARWLGDRPDVLVRGLGGVCGLGLSLAALRLGGRAGRWPAIFAGLVFTFDPWLSFERFSGMEAPLFGLVLLLVVSALLDGSAARTGWCCAALTLLRPEGLAVTAFAALWLRHRRVPVRGMLLPLAVCLLPWMLSCWTVSDRPWPSTFETKAGFVLDPALLWASVRALLADTGWGWALPIALGVGVISLEGGRADLGVLPLLLGLALGAAVLLTRAVEPSPLTGRVPYYWARYALLAWPLLLFVAGAGVASLVRTAYAGLLCRPKFGALLVAPLLLVIAAAWTWPGHAWAMPARFAAECADIEALHVAAGRWIAAHTPPDALVATHDAGAIRFFGERPVLDLYGIHDHRRLALERTGDAAAVTRALVAREPDVLAVFPVLWAHGHSPEAKALWQHMSPQDWAALEAHADDYAALFGLTRRVAEFRVDEPSAVPGPLHSVLAVYMRP